MTRKFCLFLMLLAPLFLSGCVVQPLNASMQASGQNSLVAVGTDADSGIGGYRLKPLDPIYLRFSGILEQQQLEVVIDENGEISLLHLPPVKAAGLTPSELEAKIESLYIDGGIYKNVSVNVTMTAKVYYVQGEVQSPGQFQLATGTTLLQAIAGARGPTAFANLRKVTVTRQGKIYTFSLKKLEKDPSLDVKIEAGDVIKVWQQWY